MNRIEKSIENILKNDYNCLSHFLCATYLKGFMINLKGKVTIITGGSRGIGAATAILFAQAGSDVAINFNTNKEAAAKIQQDIEKLDRMCVTVQADLSHSEDVKKFIDATMKKLGKIDILVNNHGIWNDGPIGEMSEETWDKMMDVNLKSFFLLCQAGVRIMRKQGGGRIINLSSTAGQRGEALHSHYAATKGAIISFTKSLAAELAQDNILVNSVAPGWVDTDLNTSVFLDAKIKKEISDGIPLKRIPSPEDIAGPILFLASDFARHITGEVINVNGGAVLCG